MTLIENVAVALGNRPRYGALAALLPTARYHEAERCEEVTARDLLARVGLAANAERLAGTLSYGEQRRLEIARALATEPKLLLLDEPTAGMNSSEKQQIMDEIVKLDERGLSILIIEHDMRFVMNLCQEITVLNFGRVIAQGGPEEIRAAPDVIEAYLGHDD
jgi:branched-chain amino acid transport system ATP-binding protein